jgi:hypothetical protein
MTARRSRPIRVVQHQHGLFQQVGFDNSNLGEALWYELEGGPFGFP